MGFQRRDDPAAKTARVPRRRHGRQERRRTSAHLGPGTPAPGACFRLRSYRARPGHASRQLPDFFGAGTRVSSVDRRAGSFAAPARAGTERLALHARWSMIRPGARQPTREPIGSPAVLAMSERRATCAAVASPAATLVRLRAVPLRQPAPPQPRARPDLARRDGGGPRPGSSRSGATRWAPPLLYTSFVVHPLNAFWVLYRRRTLRMPAWEATQLLLGLTIPPLLAAHFVGTRLAHDWYGQEDVYHRVALVLLGASDRPSVSGSPSCSRRLAPRLHRHPLLASPATLVSARGAGAARRRRPASRARAARLRRRRPRGRARSPPARKARRRLLQQSARLGPSRASGSKRVAGSHPPRRLRRGRSG